MSEETIMTKRKIKETTYEYDQDGKVVRKTVTVTDETDDTAYIPSYYQYTNPVQFAPASCQVMDTAGMASDHV